VTAVTVSLNHHTIRKHSLPIVKYYPRIHPKNWEKSCKVRSGSQYL